MNRRDAVGTFAHGGGNPVDRITILREHLEK